MSVIYPTALVLFSPLLHALPPPTHTHTQEVSMQSGGGLLLRRGSPGLAIFLMTGPARTFTLLCCSKLHYVKCVI